MSGSSPFSLVARGLARSHGPRVVLDGVDVDVGPRTRLGVVGPNGVGKTTLLLVTHDRQLLEAMRVTRTISVEAGGVSA